MQYLWQVLVSARKCVVTTRLGVFNFDEGDVSDENPSVLSRSNPKLVECVLMLRFSIASYQWSTITKTISVPWYLQLLLLSKVVMHSRSTAKDSSTLHSAASSETYQGLWLYHLELLLAPTVQFTSFSTLLGKGLWKPRSKEKILWENCIASALLLRRG